MDTTMPFKNFFKKIKSHSEPSSPTSSSKKFNVGLKAVQAQQNPEPIYDLSNCNSSSLPDDTYTFCKILGKSSLIIKNNCLTSLESGGSLHDLSELELLDASYNKIEKLPSTISFLENLKVLNLSFNKLRHLPNSFRSLISLKELYLSSNKFSKVPPVLCALPKLRVLSLKDNNINKIPKEITSLHRSLQTLELDSEKIDNVPHDIIANGVKGIMTHFCELEGIEYNGPEEDISDDTDSSLRSQIGSYSPPPDDIMIEYMNKKQQQLKAQILEEERLRALEKEQLETVLQHTSKSKEELLHELSSSPFEMSGYEDKKQEKILDHLKLEQKFRDDQDEQIDLYLSNTSNKEALLMDISALEDTLQNEVEAIVAAKEREKVKLVKELEKTEQDTDLALKEIINLQQAPKSLEFINLIKEQDEKMQEILSGLVEVSSEIRRKDVLKAMQNLLLEEALVEAQKDKIEKKQNSWALSLLKEGELEEKHIQNLLNDKASNQESFLTAVLEEEEYMAEAFKLLLLKMDLKRNNVIRQIALIEYELTRLSSLELRKKQCGIQYGSTTMLNQRKTLVGLLQSLLKVKKERDDELGSWVMQLSENKNSDLTPEDFWLLQYQRLMTLKPAAIAEAETDLDPKVYKVLSMASAMDLLPLFAKHQITFSALLDMSEADFATLDIGSATYHSIQRALHSYLLGTKLGSQSSYDEVTPSAPELEEESEEAAAADLPTLGDRATAPPLEAQFIETECVVCLNSDCRVLFIPCGHVCVCSLCCQPLITCPLCRCNITEKCFINAQ